MGQEFVESEKEFLHQLSTPLMVGGGWLERWQARDPQIIHNEEFINLQKQMDRLRELVLQRREWLYQMDVKEKTNSKE